MPPEITPEQQAQLAAWPARRDAMLAEASILAETKKKLVEDNDALAASNSDLHDRINQALGRMAAIDAEEKDYQGIVAKEVSELIVQKSSLQSEVAGLKNEIGILQSQKATLTDSISNLKDAYDRVFQRAEVLDKVVDHVTRVSESNASVMENSTADFKKNVDEMMSILNKNIEKANFIITKVPEVYFELQRQNAIKKQTIK